MTNRRRALVRRMKRERVDEERAVVRYVRENGTAPLPWDAVWRAATRRVLSAGTIERRGRGFCALPA